KAAHQPGRSARRQRAIAHVTTVTSTAAPRVCVTPRWKASGRPTSKPGTKSRSGALASTTAPARRSSRCGPGGRSASYARYPAVACARQSAMASGCPGRPALLDLFRGGQRRDGGCPAPAAERQPELPERHQVAEAVAPQIEFALAHALSVVDRHLQTP